VDRFIFINGFSKVKAQRKVEMLRDYAELIATIDMIDEEAEYDIDWNGIREGILNMWNFFYERYLPQGVGSKHKGSSVIEKSLENNAKRKQLVRVMTEQLEKLKNS